MVPTGTAPAGAARWVPVGLGGLELEVRGWLLHPGDGVLVAGPARSGRSTTLVTIASQARRAGSAVLAISGVRSPLRWCEVVSHQEPPLLEVAGASAVLAAAAEAVGAEGPPMLVIDDAESLEDPHGTIARLLAQRWIIVVAARNDALRSAYGHWSRDVRRSRLGLLLRPDVDLDGDLLGVRLPRRSIVPLDRPGRGYLVDGAEPTIVQAAR